VRRGAEGLGPAVLAARIALADLADPAAGAVGRLWSLDPILAVTPDLPALRVAPFGGLPPDPLASDDGPGRAAAGPRPRVLAPVRVESREESGRRAGGGSRAVEHSSRRMAEPIVAGGDRRRAGSVVEEVVYSLAAAGRAGGHAGEAHRRRPRAGIAEPVATREDRGGSPLAPGAAPGTRQEALPGTSLEEGPRETAARGGGQSAAPAPGQALAELTASLWRPSGSTGSAWGRTPPEGTTSSHAWSPEGEAATPRVERLGFDVGHHEDDEFGALDAVRSTGSDPLGGLPIMAADRSAPAGPGPWAVQPHGRQAPGPPPVVRDPWEAATSSDDADEADPHDLAEMVNRALVEQARRAGVDLS
jgi:hypothetical protein